MKRKDLYDDTLALNAESRGPRVDELSPARGFINGAALGLVFWLALAAIVRMAR